MTVTELLDFSVGKFWKHKVFSSFWTKSQNNTLNLKQNVQEINWIKLKYIKVPIYLCISTKKCGMSSKEFRNPAFCKFFPSKKAKFYGKKINYKHCSTQLDNNQLFKVFWACRSFRKIIIWRGHTPRTANHAQLSGWGAYLLSADK